MGAGFVAGKTLVPMEKTGAAQKDEAISTAAPAEIEQIVHAEHADPFRVLGPHSVEVNGRTRLCIRVFQPRAEEVMIEWNPRRPDENRIGASASGTSARGQTKFPATELHSGAKTAATRPHAGTRFPATQLHTDGFFEAILPAEIAPEEAAPESYRIVILYDSGHVEQRFDAYAFPAQLTDYDLHLMGEGTHYLKYEKLGAHVRECSGVRGAHFAVWAPNARRVSVVGDFNAWDGRVNPLRSRGNSGTWEIFLPGLDEGWIYKFEIQSRLGGPPTLKADPYAFAAELRPKTGSVVYNIEGYEWNDRAWLEARAKSEGFRKPISIYEVHLGSWRRSSPGNRWLTYRELAGGLLPYVKKMGYTHIELMPVMEHPFDGSWGYQTVGYYAATSRYGSPKDFMYLIDRCHQEGIGVLLDWTPAHFPRDAHGLGFFDGTHLYEHADPRMGEHPDWGTMVFNYGRNEVQNFLISNALFWLDKYHADGLRVDAVASMLYLDYSRKAGQWVPNAYGGRENLEAIAFIRRLNEVVHERHLGALTIAEESTSWPAVSKPTYVGGLGFDFKWNMGWMNDTLRYFSRDSVFRKYHQNELTFSMLYAFSENFLLPLSHDEVVHGKSALLSKMPGDDWRKFANLRLLYGYMYAHPGKKLLFMGGEIAQWREWSHEMSLDWHLMEYAPHRGIARLVEDLNHVYKGEAALWEVDGDWTGFEWIDPNDAEASVLSFVRRAKDAKDFVLVVCNFTPIVREGYRVGVPESGFYREILNTDSENYGGSNVGNAGGFEAEAIPASGRPYSLSLRLPPLAAVYFKLRRD
ncbi:MAG: 1,4-alpha-glucan branching protein GlgB [Candidatus Acidiferrales bacterium]